MANNLPITPCQYAIDRHRNLVLWRNLWTILLFAFGASVVVFLGLAVLFLLQEDWLPAALTTLGTIAQGAAISWVVDRRTGAVQEEEAAYRDVQEKCSDTRAADAVKARHRILGRIL